MTNSYATYKIVRRPSVEEIFPQPQGNLYHQNPYPGQRFFTEKKITLGNHHRYHSGLKVPNAYKNLLQNSIEPLQDQQLQYSQTQLQNQMLKTLQDLGIRRGHSFEKEKIDFSLSSDILNTEHENQVLKKKMNEMKKQVQFLRQNDEKLTQEFWQQKIKSSNLENQLSHLKSQFMQYKQKASKLQEQITDKQQKLEQMLNLINNKNTTQGSTRMDGLLDQLQNLKKMTLGYEGQIQKLKEQYQQQLNSKTASLSSQLNQFRLQFAAAKEIGQQQINKLTAIIFQKDRQIVLLKQKLSKKQISEKKKSTLVSDNPQNFRQHKKVQSYYQQLDYQYKRSPLIERFLKFQRLIDEKIRRSKGKERKNGQRISKSVIAGKKQGREQSQIRLNQLQRQSNNLSLLLQKNQRLKYPDTVIERFHTDSNHY